MLSTVLLRNIKFMLKKLVCFFYLFCHSMTCSLVGDLWSDIQQDNNMLFTLQSWSQLYPEEGSAEAWAPCFHSKKFQELVMLDHRKRWGFYIIILHVLQNGRPCTYLGSSSAVKAVPHEALKQKQPKSEPDDAGSFLTWFFFTFILPHEQYSCESNNCSNSCTVFYVSTFLY